MLFQFTTDLPKLNETFDLIPISTELKTLLQVVANGESSVAEWGVSVLPTAKSSGWIKVELVEVDVGATVTPIHPDNVGRMDDWAVRNEYLTHYFVWGQEGTGFNATDEGNPTRVRLLDKAIIRTDGSVHRLFPAKSRKIKPNSVVRIRVQSTVDVKAIAHLTIDC